MNAQVITTEYTGEFPVQPWAAVVRTAASTAAASEASDAVAGFAPDAPVRRKQRDRGASAVEWVIITGIVVAIVVGVGVVISGAITTKANQTGNDITNSSTGGTTGGATGN